MILWQGKRKINKAKVLTSSNSQPLGRSNYGAVMMVSEQKAVPRKIAKKTSARRLSQFCRQSQSWSRKQIEQKSKYLFLVLQKQ